VTDVTLRRCTLRVVRRGGWSWGAEPRRLLNDAMRALPGLLAAELERLVPEDAEGEVTAPLRVDVRTSLRELREWVRSAASRNESGAESPQPLAQAVASPEQGAIAEALRHALAAARITDRIRVPQPTPARAEVTSGPPEPHERARALMKLLEVWRAAGALEVFLRDLPQELVIAWHRVIFAVRARGTVASGEAPATGIEPRLIQLAQRAVGASTLERTRLRLQAVVELMSDAAKNRAPADGCASVDSAITLEIEETVARPVAPPKPRENPALRAPAGFEIQVANTLPFLLLGPLHRIGWLDVLDSTLAGGNLGHALPSLALALASKVLPEPERGWRRLPATTRAAMTFAGDVESRPEAELLSLARSAAPLMPALDAVVRRSLLDGRSPGDTLLACDAGNVRLVVDPPGVFLLAHAEQGDELAAKLLEGHAPVFIPEEDADARMLAELDRAGVTFVTPARPVRDERWTSVPGTWAPRLYSNRPVQRILPPPESAAERARESWRAFERRPLPGRPPDPALDRALSLAAALALGTMAWELWRTRESTDPLLALERFGDLDGSVRFEPHRVRVRLPMGKRFRDLKDAGLLEDIPRVPWLDFRTLVFAGG